jgi:signal peptidase I
VLVADNTESTHVDDLRVPRFIHFMTRCVRGFCAGAVGTLAVLTIAMVVMSSLSRHHDGLRGFGGEVLIVRSGSMSPTFDTGDAVIIRPVSENEATTLEPGRIVTFHTDDNATLVTHRIVARTTDDNGSRTFRTKGDANQQVDSESIAPANVIGVYSTRLPHAGYLLFALQRPRLGIVLLCALLLAHLAVLMTRTPITTTQQQEEEMT